MCAGRRRSGTAWTARGARAGRRRTSAPRSGARGVGQRAGGADRAAGAGRQKGCLFCCDKRSPDCVGRARRLLVRRTCRTPPRSLLRLPAVAKGSPLSRDETLPGTGPLQRRSNAKVFARRCTSKRDPRRVRKGHHPGMTLPEGEDGPVPGEDPGAQMGEGRGHLHDPCQDTPGTAGTATGTRTVISAARGAI